MSNNSLVIILYNELFKKYTAHWSVLPCIRGVIVLCNARRASLGLLNSPTQLKTSPIAIEIILYVFFLIFRQEKKELKSRVTFLYILDEHSFTHEYSMQLVLYCKSSIYRYCLFLKIFYIPADGYIYISIYNSQPVVMERSDKSA